MPKLSKESYNLIEKKYPNNKIWKKMKEDWATYRFNEREILHHWTPEFLTEIREFLECVYNEEIRKIKEEIALVESYDDDVVQGLVEREAEVLKNKLQRIHKNSTICDKINQFIKRRFV